VQKVYILRANEEDGVLLDAMLAQGIEPDESEFSNPRCPRCSSSTLLAFTEGDDYEVMTWYELDEKDVAGADTWYMVCSHLECDWEEQVLRATHPMGATLFLLNQSFHLFDDQWSLGAGPPVRQKRLVAYINRLQTDRGARKLQAFVEECEWHYQEKMTSIRNWLRRVPAGRTVRIDMRNEQVKGTFLTAVDDGCMLMQDNGEVVTIDAETIYTYYPRRFDRWGPAEEEVQRDLQSVLHRAAAEPDSWYTICGMYQRVVVRGCELEFDHVDPFGRYNVHTRDRQVAEALGLKQQNDTSWWEGWFRRSEIEARYDVNEMVKVKGYWLEVSGITETNQLFAVSTEDPDAASALGLTLQTPLVFEEQGEPPLDQKTPRWYGNVHPNAVEEKAEAKSWYWPLPEVHIAGGDGKR
jgi:hypothetical protein